jgi:hypothetical protein
VDRDNESPQNADIDIASDVGGTRSVEGTLQEDLSEESVALDSLERKFTLAPRAVAIAGGIFGVACLTTLAIVASVDDADGLATIALALAILAFVIQILVFIAQAHSSSQQMLRSEQLNTQTRALLVEMQATARSTHSMVGEQFSKVLSAFMDAAKSAEGKGDFDQEAFERRLIANIRQEQGAVSSASRSDSKRPRARRASPVRRLSPDVVFDSGPFPSEDEAQPILPVLNELSQEARQRLKKYGRDKQTTRGGVDEYMGYSASGPFQALDRDLMSKGLLKLVRLAESGPGEDGLVFQLTELGDLAANVLGSSGPVPAWAAPVLMAGD